MGPTCSGKTAAAIHLQSIMPVHLISVDSALIYRDMNIGTAKPDINEHPHALVDIISPVESYSVAEFIRDVKREVDYAWDNQKLPVLVGGTMMYYNALLKGLSDIPESTPEIRESVTALQQQHGTPYLHEMLKERDPILYERLNPNDTQRVSRAIEVYQSSGKPLSYWQSVKPTPVFTQEQVMNVLLIPVNRKKLHANIEKRFDEMLELGFMDEVKHLLGKYPLILNHPAMRCVGYRQALEYLEGKVDFDTMRLKSIAATRQLAKRQLTWLRSWQSGICFDVESDYYQVLSDLVSLGLSQ